MENPSHSFCRTQSSKKLYNDHGFAAKAVYDDVFGGLPRFGAPTFSPRSEDYCEIFGPFKASRGSSIPFLDLPVVGETELLFDVRDSNFDYSDIFGGFNGGVDFAVSYEQLLQQSEKGDDSSDKAWTPTESEYLSEESDPPARAAMHQIFSNRDSHQSFDDIMQFNDSCCETNYRNSEDISNWMTHGNHLRSVSEISSVDDESSSMQTNKEKKTSLKVTDDVNVYMDLNKEMMGQKHFRKTKSLSAKDSAGLQTFGSDSKAQRRYYYHVFHPNETLITVSDISLRTCPSQVSPPSRLPPVLDIEKGNYEAPTNCAFVGTPDDSSPPSFDVEVDASSSAAGSAHVIKDALGKAQVNLRGVKELMDKKEVLRNSMNLGLKNDVKDKEGKEDKTVDGSKILVKEKVQENCVADDNRVDAFVGKQKQEPKETSDIFTDAIEEESLLNAAEMSARKKHGKNSKDPYRTDGTGEWKEAMDFFELRTEVRGAGGWEKNNRTVKEGIEAHEGNKTENRSKAAKVAHPQEEHAKNVKVVNTEQKESEQKSNIGWKHNIYEEKLTEVDKWEGHEKLTRKHEVELKDALKLQYRFEHEDKMKVGKIEEIEKKLEEAWKGAVNEDKSNNDFEKAEHEKRLQQILEKEENMKIFKEVPRWAELDFRKEESEQRFKISLEQQENKNKVVLENEEDEKRLKEVFELEDNAKESKEAVLQEGDEDKQLHANEREVTEKRHKENCELEMLEKRLEEAWGREEEEILEEARERKRNGKKSRGASESKKVEDRSKQPGKLEKAEPWLKCSGEKNKVTALCTSHEQNERGRTVNKLKLAHKNSLLMEGDNLKFSGGTSKQEDYKNLQETQVARKHEGNSGKLGKAQLACAREENEKVKIEAEDDRKQLGAVKMAKALSEEGFRATRMAQFHSEPEDNGIRMKDSEESLTSSYYSFGNGQTQNQKEKKASSVDFDSESLKENICHDWDGKGKTVSRGQVFSDPKPNNNTSMSAHQVKEKVEIGRTVEVQSTAMQGRGNTQKIAQQVNLNHIKNRKEKKDTHASEEKELMKKEQELEKDRLRKMEEEIEREKEREKDRMAVEIATCEARAWANIEAHERAERAAVESANAVARQRALGEAQVRLEKECAREKSVAEKVSMEGRPGVERVAVERATADSREHAVERELVERAPDDARERVEANKYSASSQDVGITGSTSSSDLQRRVYSSGFSHPNASGCAGIDIESAQRCRARLERHRRTSERAEKALAEKNMRDLLAQREQAERIRLAETLDAEIKRWSNGKEGNLSALLSTLQYILGTGSGWQPIPLTDVITAVAVKKAYRKATLCVHPDKLQQRGASIHQKYICEKVFDLLKEAWNKFNSEER